MFKELYHSRLFNFILLLLFAFLFFGGLYITRDFLVPISFAALLAMLLLPVVTKFESWRLPKSVSIILALFILFLILGLVITMLSTQISGFAEDVPIIKKNMTEKIENMQGFIHQRTGVAPDKQLTMVKDRLSGMLEMGGSYAQKILAGTTGTLANFGLVVIYSFFFLSYRTRFVNFILKITPAKDEKRTKNVIVEISKVTQNYLSGVFTVMFILAILNITGLLIIGVRHAIFFGVLAAMLNIIPYLGSFIGGLIPTIYVFITKDSIGLVAATGAVFITTQFLENNFFTPLIVGSKVKVNPLATLVSLFIGSFLWGVAGMILFIPFLGVTKIIFDNVESLEPYAYLIGGDENSEDDNFLQKIFRKLKSKFSSKS